jgi:hypothetical protein
MAPSNCEKV